MKPIYILFIILTVMILLVGKCSHSVYTNVSKGFENFPEYAKKDVIYRKYNALLASIDKAVEQSDSYLSLAAKLEKLPKPDDVIYFSIERHQANSLDDTERMVLIKKIKAGNISKILINGTGYGQVDGQNILIIDYPVNQYNVKSCLVYFVDKQAKNSEAVPKKQPTSLFKTRLPLG